MRFAATLEYISTDINFHVHFPQLPKDGIGRSLSTIESASGTAVYNTLFLVPPTAHFLFEIRVAYCGELCSFECGMSTIK